MVTAGAINLNIISIISIASQLTRIHYNKRKEKVQTVAIVTKLNR